MEILRYTVYGDNGCGGTGACFTEAYVGGNAGGYHRRVYDVHKRYAEKDFLEVHRCVCCFRGAAADI